MRTRSRPLGRRREWCGQTATTRLLAERFGLGLNNTSRNGLEGLLVDGTRTIEEMAREVAERFDLLL